MRFLDRLMQLFSPEWRARGHKMLRDVIAVFSAIRDPAVPWTAKAAALGSILYLILPLDIIPDVIPGIGWLDDLAVIPLACMLAAKMVPPGVLDRYREAAEFKLIRWGPLVKRGLFAFVLVWGIMALIGLAMFFFGGKPDEKGKAGAGSNWEQHLTRELKKQTE